MSCDTDLLPTSYTPLVVNFGRDAWPLATLPTLPSCAPTLRPPQVLQQLLTLWGRFLSFDLRTSVRSVRSVIRTTDGGNAESGSVTGR